MAGLIIKEFVEHLNRDRQTTNAIEQSTLAALREDSLLKTLANLKLRAAQKDIKIILLMEQAAMTHTLAFDANSPEEKRSLEAGIAQSEEALGCLNLLTDNPTGYAEYSKYLYGAKERIAGLPLDPFRKFIRSQTARLTNRLAGEGSLNRKQLFRQRKDNLAIINELYMELQRTALGAA